MSKNRFIASITRFTMAIVVALVAAVALVPSSASAGTITGVYEIKNTQGVRCLTAPSGYLVVQNCANTANQKFQFERMYYDAEGVAWFEIHPKSNESRCLGLVFDSGSNGVALQPETCNGGSAQKFTLVVQSTGSDGNVIVKIQNKFVGKCLQADNPWQNNTYVTQWGCSPLDGGYYTNWQFRWLAHS